VVDPNLSVKQPSGASVVLGICAVLPWTCSSMISQLSSAGLQVSQPSLGGGRHGVACTTQCSLVHALALPSLDTSAQRRAPEGMRQHVTNATYEQDLEELRGAALSPPRPGILPPEKQSPPLSRESPGAPSGFRTPDPLIKSRLHGVNMRSRVSNKCKSEPRRWSTAYRFFHPVCPCLGNLAATWRTGVRLTEPGMYDSVRAIRSGGRLGEQTSEESCVWPSVAIGAHNEILNRAVADATLQEIADSMSRRNCSRRVRVVPIGRNSIDELRVLGRRICRGSRRAS